MGAIYIQVLLRTRRGTVPADGRPIQTPVHDVEDRLDDLKPWIDKARQIARAAIEDEFLRGRWRPAAGGDRPWREHVQYPEYVSHPDLIVTGDYLAAWLGQGPGRIDEEDETSFTIGVAGFPGARVHRGGDSATTARETVTEIFVTPKMRWFLGLVLGLWLKKETTHIRIPSRPHATPDRATREAMRDALRDYLVGNAESAVSAVGRAAA